MTNWLSKQYGIDPVRLKHLVKFIMGFVRARVDDKKSLVEIEHELLAAESTPFEVPPDAPL